MTLIEKLVKLAEDLEKEGFIDFTTAQNAEQVLNLF